MHCVSFNERKRHSNFLVPYWVSILSSVAGIQFLSHQVHITYYAEPEYSQMCSSKNRRTDAES